MLLDKLLKNEHFKNTLHLNFGPVPISHYLLVERLTQKQRMQVLIVEIQINQHVP